jgi:lipopolysaccharide/colanic/teichoic acid biosynthesis glycosyltransferase
MRKRAMDVGLSLVGLIVSAPILLVCAFAIVLDSKGNPIFRQERVGRDSRSFTCYKLRTMRVGTPTAATHEVSQSQVTRVGEFLRRTKLDELPQLWNVLRGEMSLVGPRPCLPMQVALIEARRERGVMDLRPGITGVAQLKGIDMSDPERLAAVDATYIGDVSLWTDIRLIVQTVTRRHPS